MPQLPFRPVIEFHVGMLCDLIPPEKRDGFDRRGIIDAIVRLHDSIVAEARPPDALRERAGV